jgi:hypothetical protein
MHALLNIAHDPFTMALPRQLTSYYHLSHYFMIAYFFLSAYPSALRPNSKENERAERYLNQDGFVFPIEIEIFVGAALFFCWELKKEIRSFDEGMHRFLLDCKILTLLLAFLTGNDYFMFGLVATYASIAMLLEPPTYDGESNVIQLNDQERFDEVVLENCDKTKPYLVMFQSKWGDIWDAECHFFTPSFCELSVELKGRMHFATLDVTTCPNLARGLLIADDAGVHPQLPVLVMFHRGKEIRRLPQVNENGKVKKIRISKQKVISHFELNAVDPTKVSYFTKKDK